MKSRRLLIMSAVAGALVLSSGNARAQLTARPLGFGGYAGASFPLGDFKSEANNGYHVGAFGMLYLTRELSVRADASYNNFRSKDLVFPDATITEKTQLLIGTVNLHYDLGTIDEMAAGGGALPYISGGPGVYRFMFEDTCGATGCGSATFGDARQTHWGYNVGGGVWLPKGTFIPMVDIRYHTVLWNGSEAPNAHFFLASIGWKFR
jgi:hypothetical protein